VSITQFTRHPLSVNQSLTQSVSQPVTHCQLTSHSLSVNQSLTQSVNQSLTVS